jgi:hypothetical protein
MFELAGTGYAIYKFSLHDPPLSEKMQAHHQDGEDTRATEGMGETRLGNYIHK